MSNARPTAEQLHKKYQSALQAYARQLADPLLRLDFLQEADPFFRRCALGVWCWGGSITETHVALYNGIYAPDSQPPRALYFEVASGAMAAPTFQPPGFFRTLCALDQGANRKRCGQFIQLCQVLMTLFAAAAGDVTAKQETYIRQCLEVLESMAQEAGQPILPPDVPAPEFHAADTSTAQEPAETLQDAPEQPEPTVEELLAELDGFDPGKGVIVLGATNRPEVLDKALLRPGRFDRRITVDRPNLAGRLATLQVHTRNIHLAEDVNLEKIAQATAGCVGADLANLVNEAALRAVRKGRKAVNQNDLLVAFEVVIAGSEKKGTVITDEEKKIIAYHEVGHALVAAKQKNAQPVSKITIVPHTQGALGYTLHLPEEEKFLMSKEDILAEIRTLLAGRSSEEIVCNTMTSGAANDIERATEMARNLVARFGMCDEFDMMALGTVQSQYLDGSYSMSCAQETYAAADRETIKIIRQCHQEAKQILRDNRELLDKIAAYLLKKETITGQEMMAIIEGRDPETVDNYGATREDDAPRKAFRPSTPNSIEAPAKHINIVSQPIPMPDFEEPKEEKPAASSPEENAPEDKSPKEPPADNGKPE